MSGSTWTWIGGTINVDISSDWTLTAGPGNPTGIPKTGDTAINDGTLVGYGLIAAALINNGTVEVSNNSIPGSSTGGDLEIQGSVSGTGSMTIAPAATLQIDGSLGSGQSITFSPGVPETLILGSPNPTIANPIVNYSAADRIELAKGLIINSVSVVSGNTLAINYTNAAGTTLVANLTDVGFNVSPGLTVFGADYLDLVTGDFFVAPTTYLVWQGGNGSFDVAANWNLGIVPNITNSVVFNNGIGGTISGTGTAEQFSFHSLGTWVLAPGTDLTAPVQIFIGASGAGVSGGGALTIGTGSTVSVGDFIDVAHFADTAGTLVVSGGGVLDETAPGSVSDWAMNVGESAVASGTVLVTGAGSTVNLGGNGLSLGKAGGNASVMVAQGGSLFAATPNSNVSTSIELDNGTLTVTDPGSEVTARGVVVIARTATGTLTVENSATFLAATDPVGIAALNVGAGGTGGFGGTGVADILSGGNLISQGNITVGRRGTAGQLNVNGGTVQVGTTLTVGAGGTIAPGTVEPGSGTLTIGVGGTVELTGTAQTSSFGVYLSNSNIGTPSTETAVATVSGTGAALNTDGNGLAVANYGTAALTVSQGGSVASGTPNSNLVAALAIGTQGSGTVTVTDPNSQTHCQRRCHCWFHGDRQPDCGEPRQCRNRPRQPGCWRS